MEWGQDLHLVGYRGWLTVVVIGVNIGGRDLPHTNVSVSATTETHISIHSHSHTQYTTSAGEGGGEGEEGGVGMIR